MAGEERTVEEQRRRLEALEARIARLEERLDDAAHRNDRVWFDSGSVHPELEDRAIAP